MQLSPCAVDMTRQVLEIIVYNFKKIISLLLKRLYVISQVGPLTHFDYFPLLGNSKQPQKYTNEPDVI